MKITLPKSLSVRLKTLTFIWLVVAVISILLTMLLSWRLEGGAAAINDAGSLRMQTYRLGLSIQQHAPLNDINNHIKQFDQTITTLQQGDPSRPLFLPNTPDIQQKMTHLQQHWQYNIKPMLHTTYTQHTAIHEAHLKTFIHIIDDLTHAVESINTRYISWLRLFQSVLLAMVLLSSAVTIVLLYLWIIRPLQTLQDGVDAIYDQHFGTQVPIDESTEFARLNKGFNQMSTRLQQLYEHLEHEVAEKTSDLTEKNHTLEILYYFSRFLNKIQIPAEAAQEFLKKIMTIVPAQAGSIRLIDTQRQRLDLIADVNLPETLKTAESCQRFDDCLCGHAVQHNTWQPIQFTQSYIPNEIRAAESTCQHLGFQHLRVFQIHHHGQDLGLMTLYFTEAHQLDEAKINLLETLCRQLGSTLSNIRLVGESRQLAVLQERNLMAQGLHDSIAQTLTFLNLQVQMLESALHAQQPEQVNENLQFIKEGIQECYDDVRELLLNFRTKITRKEFAEAVHTLTQRFEQQTHVPVNVYWHGDGPPLSAEQQLQFIFILQESLSNIRKHAHASHVHIEFNNQQDFIMTIHDDGRGFDTARLHKLSNSHVGLGIMHERAQRIHAILQLDSKHQQYTTIRLTLPQQERILE